MFIWRIQIFCLWWQCIAFNIRVLTVQSNNWVPHTLLQRCDDELTDVRLFHIFIQNRKQRTQMRSDRCFLFLFITVISLHIFVCTRLWSCSCNLLVMFLKERSVRQLSPKLACRKRSMYIYIYIYIYICYFI